MSHLRFCWAITLFGASVIGLCVFTGRAIVAKDSNNTTPPFTWERAATASSAALFAVNIILCLFLFSVAKTY